jgi:hypothetical protein
MVAQNDLREKPPMGSKTVTQLAVFIENRAGRLAEVCSILGENRINILGFSIADAQDYGIFRVIVKESERAANLLRDAGFTVKRREVLCVDVPHRPGGLASILRLFSDARINVEYLYAIAHTLIIFNLDEIEKGSKILTESNVALKSAEEIES